MPAIVYKQRNYIWNNGQTYIFQSLLDNICVILKDIGNNCCHINLQNDSNMYIIMVIKSPDLLFDDKFVRGLSAWLNRIHSTDFDFEEDENPYDLTDKDIDNEYIAFDDWWKHFNNAKTMLKQERNEKKI